MPSSPRRFPPPWSIEELNDACFVVSDGAGQITPSTPSNVPSVEARPPSKEEPASTTAQSEQEATPRTVHHHHHRGHYIVVRPSLGSYSCGYLGCVRLYSWAFPCQYYSRYCLPQFFYVH